MKQAFFLITRKISDLRSLDKIAPGTPVVCLCTTAGLLDECSRQGFRAILLTEELLSGHYRSINLWAYQEVRALTEHFKPQREAFLFFESYHAFLRALFIHLLSVELILKRLISEQGIRHIGLVESKPSFLNLAVRTCLEERHPGIDYTVLPSSARSGDAKPPADPKKFIKRFFARLCGPAQLGGGPAKKAGRKLLLVSGALNHLAPLIGSLRKTEPVDILFVENVFDLNKFFYCLRRGFKYVVLDAPHRQPEYKERLAGHFEKRPVRFGDNDLTRICARTFSEALGNRDFYPYFYSFYDPPAAAGLFEGRSIDGVLLDEDFSPRRLFAALAAASHRPSFVVSHGIPYVHVEGDPSLLTTSSALTFVNSEFEKEVYRKIFYPDGNLIAAGLPRYDGLLDRPRPVSRGAQSVLFCSSSMEEWDFEAFYYGAGERDVLGDRMKAYLKDLLDAVDRPGELVLKIKPHYDHERHFKALFKEWGVRRTDVELLSHGENLFDQMLSANLVITTESTVICEALKFGKPVIVLDYPRRLTRPDYEARGVVLRVTNREELCEAVRKVFQDAGCVKELENNRAKAGNYFTGPSDGKNSSRVAGIIWEHLQK